MRRWISVALLLLSAAGASSAAAACREDRVTVRGDWGQANFTVEVADDSAERGRGLMYVEQMPTMAGMLFVYDAPQRATFWMRNTLIPLDMLFAGPDGTVLTVHENAVPLDETTIDGGEGVKFVLEINGGMAGRLGIEPGDVLQHPSIGAAAAAPCAS
ncbi:DUF192 domain-containing protein [Flavimaricola marinus]|uniref:ACR n=1 Tax=Flavimaricola marinus TaxID=1819565 RepID=A0A238LE36_9RHOB|nr:DUF192 domain-containing protein [Flavimaricola marinus]SMY07977.1 hypothetical protein LOM8899_02122 [Flavimaricola marinus]